MISQIVDIKESGDWEKLLNFVNSKLTPTEEGRKNRGEVFTPLTLVDDMLDKLPLDVWTNPNLKWLDPANGIGNYPIRVYMRLMGLLPDKTIGLTKKFKKEKERHNHIIKNMLYMIEFDSVNVSISKKIFGKGANILEASFFQTKKKDYPTVFIEHANFSDGTRQFDIIMGNPPYNKGGVGTGNSIWKNFINLDLLKKNGYICFVHPVAWRKPVSNFISNKGKRRATLGDTFEEFKKKGRLIYLHVSDVSPDNFPKVDYYIYQKGSFSEAEASETKVYNKYYSKTGTYELDLTKLPFIPNLVNKETVSILNKLINVKSVKKLEIIIKRQFAPNKGDISPSIKPNKYPHAWGWDDKKQDYTNAYPSNSSNQKTTRGYFRSILKFIAKDDYFYRNKIVLLFAGGKSPKLYPKFYSSKTPIGVTNHTMYMTCETKQEGLRMVKFFNSKLMEFLIKITQFSFGQWQTNEWSVLNLINYPENLPNNPTDKDIYKYYKLSKKEITLIEEVVDGTKVISKSPTSSPISQPTPTTPIPTHPSALSDTSEPKKVKIRRKKKKKKKKKKQQSPTPCEQHNMRNCRVEGCVYKRGRAPHPCQQTGGRGQLYTSIFSPQDKSYVALAGKSGIKTLQKYLTKSKSVMKKQTGGLGPYNKIYDPKSKKMVDIRSKSGLTAIKKYLNHL